MIVYYLAAQLQNLTFAPRSRAAVARRAHNPKVTGSIPVFATKNPQINRFEDFLFLAQVFGATEFDYLHFNSPAKCLQLTAKSFQHEIRFRKYFW